MDKESFFKGFLTAIELGRHFVMGLISKFITRNGTYIAANDGADGYSTVTVDVTPEFTAADEGKVVENGALVAQTSLAVTENGTYDTTTNNEVVVNVSGGGSFVGDLIGEYNNAAQGGIWYSTGHSVSADSGFVVQYKINGTIIKTIYIEKERVASPYNGAFASITTELQSNGSFYGPTYNFNLRIVSGILEVSFGGASSGFVSAKVYTAGNAAEFFASIY